ncbi:glycosyltransferase [Clostridium sp.]|jgi:teichuronic acid biosynthesis glycosyltransferase TuaH|uniref:glycosyltransferase family protein n=1 Tax=Clostridium sp. TaxID=1506 RepID=UPI0029138903|nr:glycosyltransferase [Clostridium sp.]MDU7363119.1 glycosyltransferase [Clostridium sp.]
MNNILYMSFVDWFWIKQRPQHFVEFLSEDNKVVYFCMQAWRKNSNTIIVNNDSKHEVNLSIIKKGNLTVSRKKVLPLHRKYKFIENINDKITEARLKKLDKVNNFNIVVFTHPMQLKYFPIDILIGKKVVYDCMDDYEEFNYYDNKELLKYEKKLYDISDKIVCTSDKLKEKLIVKYGNKKMVRIINNGVDLHNFNVNNVSKSQIINNSRMNNVAYIGAISEWFDFKLIKNVALRNKDINFYIIGPIEKGISIEEFNGLTNINIIGSIPYEEVPKVLYSVDVAIMPFILNDLIKAVNPVKIYEYLAMGKNVLAIRYSETEKFSEHVDLYSNEDEFEYKLRNLLNKNVDIKERIDYAKDHSWEKRVKEFYRFITD